MSKYNGWTNYETWLCKLWMDNDGDEYYGEMAADTFEGAEADDTFTRSENACLDLAERIKDYWEQILEEQMSAQYGFVADLINAGVSAVNWHEIARAYIEQIETEETA